jgi:hypothetical protein
MKPITWSFGMQSRPESRIGAKPDLTGSVDAAARVGMSEAIIFGKDHTGFCFHPTQIGVPHPKLMTNLTKGMIDELHERNMKAIAYVNFGMDGEAARRHPEWRQEHDRGVYMSTEDHYANLCLYAGYLDDYLLPVVKEIIQKYGADGIFFDTMSAFGYCCCPVCRKDFKEKTGETLPLPSDKDNPAWAYFRPYAFQKMNDTIKKIRAFIHALLPNAVVIFNHVGGPVYPFAFPGVLDGIVSCDPLTMFPYISLYANYCSSLPNTGDVFIERFARGWGDRSACSDLTMSYKSAAIFMYGQRFCVGDRMHPDASMGPGSLHAMNVISQTWHKINRLLPADAILDPDFLLLYSESINSDSVIKDLERPFRPDNFLSQLGAYRLLLDCGCSFMVTPEMALERNLHKQRLLIISSTKYLKDETEKLVSEFIFNGGIVLVCEFLPRLSDDSLPEWLGIKSEASEPYQPCIYLPDFCKRIADSERILVRGDVRNIELSSAEPLMFGYPQYDMSRMGAGYNSSGDEPTDVPLLTHNRYGKGQCYFLNCAIFSDYADSVDDGQQQWVAELLKKIGTKTSFFLEAPNGEVEVSSWRYGQNNSAHIILNHSGRRTSFGCQTEHISDPQPTQNVMLKIRSVAKNLKVTLNGRKTKFVREKKFIRIPICMDTVWKIVKVEEQ